MNNSKHVPRVWQAREAQNGQLQIIDVDLQTRAEENGYVDPAPICVIVANDIEGVDDVKNSYLIAAAPELLKAAQNILDSIRMPLKDLKGAFDNLQAAVNKAKGAK